MMPKLRSILCHEAKACLRDGCTDTCEIAVEVIRKTMMENAKFRKRERVKYILWRILNFIIPSIEGDEAIQRYRAANCK